MTSLNFNVVWVFLDSSTVICIVDIYSKFWSSECKPIFFHVNVSHTGSFDYWLSNYTLSIIDVISYYETLQSEEHRRVRFKWLKGVTSFWFEIVVPVKREMLRKLRLQKKIKSVSLIPYLTLCKSWIYSDRLI